MTQQKSSFISRLTLTLADSVKLQGILLFMLTGLLSVFINSLMRILSDEFHYHTLQLVFFYSIMGAAMYLPSVIRHPQHYRSLTTPRLYILRAVLELVGFTLVFFSLTLLPFATMTVLTFTTPIIGAVAAVWFLNESMNRNKWLGLLLGFCGILIVAQPDIDTIQWPVLLPLGASFCFATCGVLIRKMTLVAEPPSRIAFITLFFMAILSLPLAVTHWQTPAVAHAPYLLLLAVMVGTVQYTVGQSLQKIKLTTAQPFMFLNLIWSSLVGFLLFNESVAIATIFGSCFIISGIILSVRRSATIQETVPVVV